MLSHSLFQTEVLFNTPPGAVRATCSDGQLPPRIKIYQGPMGSESPDGVDAWINENCQENTINMNMHKPEGIPDSVWDDMVAAGPDGPTSAGFTPLKDGETEPYLSCNSCIESPYHTSDSDSDSDEDKTEEVVGWLKSTHQKVILATGVAGVSLGLLIMAFS